jgi:hypothetical protein
VAPACCPTRGAILPLPCFEPSAPRPTLVIAGQKFDLDLSAGPATTILFACNRTSDARRLPGPTVEKVSLEDPEFDTVAAGPFELEKPRRELAGWRQRRAESCTGAFSVPLFEKPMEPCPL